jgi:alcohol dehydrogenase class IV
MYPTLAVVDPELTYTMPPALTASTGLDALTQLLESFVSIRSNPLTDALCKEGIIRAARSMEKAYLNGTNISAREDMAIASLFGGLTLANSGLGAVHGIAGPMGGMFPVPHGVVCGRLLPFVMEINIRALHQHKMQSHLSRYDHIAQILTGDVNARAEDGVVWLHELCASFKMPKLSDFNIAQNSFREIISMSKMASSMKGNPVSLSDGDLLEILQKVILL